MFYSINIIKNKIKDIDDRNTAQANYEIFCEGISKKVIKTGVKEGVKYVVNSVLPGAGKYAATIKYKNKEYGIRLYHHLGIVYCDDRPDITFPFKVSVTTDDHNINYVMLKTNDMFIINMRFYFEHGCVRFKDLQCKEAFMTAISY